VLSVAASHDLLYGIPSERMKIIFGLVSAAASVPKVAAATTTRDCTSTAITKIRHAAVGALWDACRRVTYDVKVFIALWKVLTGNAGSSRWDRTAQLGTGARLDSKCRARKSVAGMNGLAIAL